MLKTKQDSATPPQAPERDDVVVTANRCPFCHTDVLRGDPLVVCATCLARHHTACWQESHACSSCRSHEGLAPPTPQERDLRPLGAAGIVALGGALTGTAVAVSTNDFLYIGVPILTCLVAGMLSKRYRTAIVSSAGFQAAFYATVGLWLFSGSIKYWEHFHALNFSLIVGAMGVAAAISGTFVTQRWLSGPTATTDQEQEPELPLQAPRLSE